MNFSLFSKTVLLLCGIASYCIVSPSCTKIRETEIGSELIPPVDGVNTFADTLDVYTANYLQDTIRVPYNQVHSLGNISTVDDPIFGSTDARINVELKPATYPYTFEVKQDSLTLDSVVLVLGYAGLYGDSTKGFTLNVNEISQATPMRSDSIYTNKALFTPSTLLGSRAFANATGFNDSMYLFRETAINQVRIKLNNTFGERLLNKNNQGFDTTSTGAYYNDSLFKKYFAGFQVSCTNNSRSLMQVSLTDTNTKVALYYKFTKRGGTAGAQDTTVKYFKLTSLSGSSNQIDHQRSSEMNSALANNGSNTNLYLQAGPGSFATIRIPGLSGYSNRIVHRAELLMEQVANPITDTVFRAPYLFLSVYQTDSLKGRFFVPNDISYTNGYVGNYTSFGGIPAYRQEGANAIITYNFNISRFVQGIITKSNTNYPLVLNAPYSDYVYTDQTLQYPLPIVSGAVVNRPAVGRVRLAGGRNGAATANPKRMRLRIIYSRI
jgi:hypothetical protein